MGLTQVHVVFHADPHVRAQHIDHLLATAPNLATTTLIANSEIFCQVPVVKQEALLQHDSALRQKGMQLVRLAPGCACCTSRLVIATHLSRILRLNQPKHLILELDSNAHPDQVIAMLQEPQWQGWLGDVSLFVPTSNSCFAQTSRQ